MVFKRNFEKIFFFKIWPKGQIWGQVLTLSGREIWEFYFRILITDTVYIGKWNKTHVYFTHYFMINDTNITCTHNFQFFLFNIIYVIFMTLYKSFYALMVLRNGIWYIRRICNITFNHLRSHKVTWGQP